jgi:hypothetical protein
MANMPYYPGFNPYGSAQYMQSYGQPAAYAQPNVQNVQQTAQTGQNASTCGYSCRVVTSREEALATACDFMSAGVVMLDFAHSMIYVKRFNPNTGASDFFEFAYQPPKQQNQSTVSEDFVPKSEFERLCSDVQDLRGEVERLRPKNKKEVTDNAV